VSTDESASLIALSALFQNAQAVDQLARTGQCPQNVLDCAIGSIVCTHPESVIAVYGNIGNLASGRECLARILEPGQEPLNQMVVRYALAAIQLESRLRRDHLMQGRLSKGIELVSHKIQHFGTGHSNVVEAVAHLYTDTISTYKSRIQVSGQPAHLQNPQVAAKIRTLLMAAIRAAMLWRQVGGRRWQLIFRRKTLSKRLSTL
jgi:high frequency lysogenization protein